MYKFIGAAVGHCAGILGCDKAPDYVKEKLSLSNQWLKTIYYNGEARRLEATDSLRDFSTDLACATNDVLQNKDKFIVIGGDHSCAIGTWSGVHKHCGDFGLIWIDAHMDAHTPETSHSGNIHGMPIATLLGLGSDKLTLILSEEPKLKAENIIMLGIRSYENDEQKLLDKLGVTVVMMDDIDKNGFEYYFNKATCHFRNKKIKYGISFDLDGLDPQYLEALGTPVEYGLHLKDVLESLKNIVPDEFIGLEITEYNKLLDTDDIGLGVVRKVIESMPKINDI